MWVQRHICLCFFLSISIFEINKLGLKCKLTKRNLWKPILQNHVVVGSVQWQNKFNLWMRYLIRGGNENKNSLMFILCKDEKKKNEIINRKMHLSQSIYRYFKNGKQQQKKKFAMQLITLADLSLQKIHFYYIHA